MTNITPPAETTPPLVHCIYSSAATRDFSPEELAALLTKARDYNALHDLTGMLLYSEGSFFQVLEGPQDVVDALYTKIETDKRHDQVTMIISEPIPKRAFGAWTMGFSNVSRGDLAKLEGTNDFFTRARCFAELDAGRAKKLLSAFRDGRWHKTSPALRHKAAA
jgi:Sensors of blue-light using FAD